MTAIQNVEWEECLLPVAPHPEIEREFKESFGRIPPGILCVTPCEWLAHALPLTNHTNGLLVHTDLDFSELVWLAISQDNSCRYCYAARRGFLRTLGLPEARIRRLEQESFISDARTKEGRAIDFARRLARSSPPLTGKDRQAMLEAGFSKGEVSELAFLTVLIIFLNRFSTILALPFAPIEAFPNRPLIRLLRPLLGRVLRGRRRMGRSENLDAHQRSGPFSYLVLALDGLPAARRLRDILDLAWASKRLPERTRLLIFAVVARGIGCPLAEAEVRRMLLELGIEPDEFDSILAHLGSKDLEADEARILPFARETIRIEAGDIQRKARALHEHLDTEVFLEVVGLTSVANMVCRLSVICEEP
ncbi:MAG: hypothetical protein GY944_00965 [bacterium]|nr:hypothetical protein [bacterium]